MLPVSTELLAFAAPGLVHRLGNAVFTIQGHAQLLADDGPQERTRTAILGAAARSAETLAVLRNLIAGPPSPPEAVPALMAALVDVLRVPIREAGHGLANATPAGTLPRAVAGGLFCQMVVLAVRLFVEMLPAGHAGVIELRLLDIDSNRVGVQVGFRAEAGTLPFPLPVAELCARLAALPPPARDHVGCQEVPAGLLITFPCTALPAVWSTAEP